LAQSTDAQTISLYTLKTESGGAKNDVICWTLKGMGLLRAGPIDAAPGCHFADA